MSKIFLIGDIHVGLGYPNNLEKWSKIHKDYFNNFLIPLLKKEIEEGDIIIGLGDFFDNRNIIPIDLLNYGTDIVETISKIAPFHIIIGNHDLWSKSTSEINSVRPFRYIPNVFIYDKATKVDYNGLKLLMMPYVDNRLEQIKIINDNKDCEYLFCHSDLNGAKMHLTSVANKNADKIDINEFYSFRKVYSGHLHVVQSTKNFTFVGSIFQMDRNDMGDQKGVFIIDTEKEIEIFIKNTHSPVFRKFPVITEDDIERLDEIKDTKDYIDLLISNSLLVSNRKLRRKLEIMLEKGNFATVEYIDDITKELVDDEIIEESIVDENKQEISVNLEYGEYIKEYILKQEYKNDIFKDNIISEFDEIIKIYNENYKAKND